MEDLESLGLKLVKNIPPNENFVRTWSLEFWVCKNTPHPGKFGQDLDFEVSVAKNKPS